MTGSRRRSGLFELLNFVSREEIDSYSVYVLASKKADLHITDEDREGYLVEQLERDSTVAKIRISVQDVNDNAPAFERDVYNVGINSKANINELVTLVNATDLDMGSNGTLEMLIISSNLYKFGSNRSTGSIVPSPFGEWQECIFLFLANPFPGPPLSRLQQFPRRDA